MKRGILIVAAVIVAIVAVSISTSQAQDPVGSAITYQGRIMNDVGVPYNGQCMFSMALYDAESGGHNYGNWSSLNPTTVTDGYFTIYPTWNASVWTDEAHWLELIATCGGDPTTFPRQRVYAVPYAIHSLDATVTPQPAPTLVNTATPQPAPTLVSTATPQPTPTVLANVAYTNTTNVFTASQEIDGMLGLGIASPATMITANYGLFVGAGGSLQYRTTGATQVNMGRGVYYDSTAAGYRYLTSDFGVLFQLDQLGDFAVWTAPSGVAGNAPSLTNRFRVANGGAITIHDKIATYNNVSTEGYGVPAIVDDVSIANRGSDVGSTNFTNAGTAGQYKINFYLQTDVIDVAAGAVTLTIAWTDDTVVRSVASTAVSMAASGYTQGSIYARLGSGSVSYSTSHTGNYATGTYCLYITVERLN